jgi:amidase
VSPDTAIHWLTIGELAEGYRTRALSPVEVTKALLERIARLDGRLHSYLTVTADAALAAAEQAERELRGGRDRGALHGVPLALKDLADVAGVVTSAGTTIRRDHVPTEDACVVARLREAGAVILGMLSMTEGAYASHHPAVTPPVNPWNAARWTGVSSSGSGVATAAGLCFGALGTDTGGSIRFPSACNGIVGIKPTYGRVPRHGVFPLAASLDHLGPMTRSVRDAAHLLRVFAGYDPRDPTSLRTPVPDYAAEAVEGIAGVRIGIDRRYVSEGMDARIAATVIACADVLRDAGAEVRDVTLPPWQELVQNWGVTCAVETAVAHQGTFPARAAEYGPELRGLIEAGNALPATAYARAHELRLAFAGGLRALFDEIDLLLCPSLGVPPPEANPKIQPEDVETGATLLRFTAPYDFTGSPTISLPCGFADDGMPVSLQLVGRHLEEGLLCRAGFAYERATDWHRRHPPV